MWQGTRRTFLAVDLGLLYTNERIEFGQRDEEVAMELGVV